MSVLPTLIGLCVCGGRSKENLLVVHCPAPWKHIALPEKVLAQGTKRGLSSGNCCCGTIFWVSGRRRSSLNSNSSRCGLFKLKFGLIVRPYIIQLEWISNVPLNYGFYQSKTMIVQMIKKELKIIQVRLPVWDGGSGGYPGQKGNVYLKFHFIWGFHKTNRFAWPIIRVIIGCLSRMKSGCCTDGQPDRQVEQHH